VAQIYQPAEWSKYCGCKAGGIGGSSMKMGWSHCILEGKKRGERKEKVEKEEIRCIGAARWLHRYLNPSGWGGGGVHGCF